MTQAKSVTRWTRRGPGDYVTEIDGLQVSIVNMKDQHGPNVVRWQGPIPAWEVRVGGPGEYDIGRQVLHHAWTLGEAKQWVQGWSTREA